MSIDLIMIKNCMIVVMVVKNLIKKVTADVFFVFYRKVFIGFEELIKVVYLLVILVYNY